MTIDASAKDVFGGRDDGTVWFVAATGTCRQVNSDFEWEDGPALLARRDHGGEGAFDVAITAGALGAGRELALDDRSAEPSLGDAVGGLDYRIESGGSRVAGSRVRGQRWRTRSACWSWNDREGPMGLDTSSEWAMIRLIRVCGLICRLTPIEWRACSND